jgi:electron transport complex protein RnfD
MVSTDFEQYRDLESTGGPHLIEAGASTRRIMLDVLVGLLPVTLAALWYFRGAALGQITVCLVVALASEWLVCRLRGRPSSLGDGSAAITGLILAFSLPPRLPLGAAALGAFIAVALGKMAFGGLGYNIFNPAMVGRAFLMVCFPAWMTQWAAPLTVHATTEATPLAAARFAQQFPDLAALWTGNVAGCVGETSAIMIIAGGLWLLWRRAADWRLTAGMLIAVVAVALAEQWIRGSANSLRWQGHLGAGAVLLGAFFIVTDPVSSPLSKAGRWAFGLIVGLLTMIIRLFAGYPEGVMFAVLIANALTPIINRWTVPEPVGGRTRG